MNLDIYPESVIWKMLDELNIPWQKSLKELSEKYGIQHENHDEFIAIHEASQIFNGVSIQARGEIWNKPPMEFPLNRWILRISPADSLDETFVSLTNQLQCKLGISTAGHASNAKSFIWKFGQASVKIIYWFEKVDRNGQPQQPSMSIFVTPDYRIFASDAEETLIEEALGEVTFSKPGLNFLPYLNSDSNMFPRLNRRLSGAYEFPNVTMCFHKEEKTFVGVHQFLAFLMPVSEIANLRLVTSHERSGIRYVVDAVLKAGRNDIIGGNIITLCEAPSVDSAQKIAEVLSKISELELEVEVQNNTY